MRSLVWVLSLAAAVVAVAPAPAAADRAKEFLVPPEGGSYEVQVHPNFVTILDFSEPLSGKALASDTANYEIKPYGDHKLRVPWGTKVFPNLPTGKKSKRRKEIQRGHVRDLVTLFEIEECAKRHLAILR